MLQRSFRQVRRPIVLRRIPEPAYCKVCVSSVEMTTRLQVAMTNKASSSAARAGE